MSARTRTASSDTGNIIVPDDEVDPAVAPIPGTTSQEAAANSQFLGPSAQGVPAVGMPKTVRIILDETDNMPPTGQMFSLNGRAYLIRAGEEVDIPIGLLEVIDNAVEAKPVVDPQTLKPTGYRPRHRFPYRRVNVNT